MRRRIPFLGLLLLFSAFAKAENLTLFTGATSNKVSVAGVSLSDYMIPYLQFQLDVFKFTGKDKTLHSDDPALNRDDFIAAAFNVVLKLPIHLLPHLDRLAFLEPHFLVGYGFGLESLRSAYFDVPNNEEKPGLFTKLRQYRSYGAGLVVMLTYNLGLKIDYRSIGISELKGMGYPARRFNRFTFGVCFGPGGGKKRAPR